MTRWSYRSCRPNHRSCRPNRRPQAWSRRRLDRQASRSAPANGAPVGRAGRDLAHRRGHSLWPPPPSWLPVWSVAPGRRRADRARPLPRQLAASCRSRACRASTRSAGVGYGKLLGVAGGRRPTAARRTVGSSPASGCWSIWARRSESRPSRQSPPSPALRWSCAPATPWRRRRTAFGPLRTRIRPRVRRRCEPRTSAATGTGWCGCPGWRRRPTATRRSSTV